MSIYIAQRVEAMPPTQTSLSLGVFKEETAESSSFTVGSWFLLAGHSSRNSENFFLFDGSQLHVPMIIHTFLVIYLRFAIFH